MTWLFSLFRAAIHGLAHLIVDTVIDLFLL